jgi:hypothetical protein
MQNMGRYHTAAAPQKQTDFFSRTKNSDATRPDQRRRDSNQINERFYLLRRIAGRGLLLDAEGRGFSTASFSRPFRIPLFLVGRANTGVKNKGQK